MRCLLLLCGLAAVGCEAGSRPANFAKPIEDGPSAGPASLGSVTKPDRSDPAAEQIVGELLLKHTNSEPGRIDRLRTFTVTRKGEMATGGGSMEVTLRVAGAWPDRMRAVFVMTLPDGSVTNAFGRRGEAIWNAVFRTGTPADAAPIVADKYDEARADLWAEWVLMLVPLTAPDRRLATAPADADGAVGVRVWVGEQPPVLLHIHPKTGLLTKIRYEIKSAGRAVVRTFALEDHKPVSGVLLPHRVTYNEGPQAATVYKSVEYELPPSLDPAVFNKP